ncbi:MAG: hypothetical protein AAF518_09170 [Spirochaetota bacterium]
MKTNFWKTITLTLSLVFLLSFCVSSGEQGMVKGLKGGGEDYGEVETGSSRGAADNDTGTDEQQQDATGLSSE